MDIDLKDYIPWIGGALFALVALHALYLTWRSRRARRAEAEAEQADADTLPPVLAKPLDEPDDRDPLAQPFVPPNAAAPAAAAPALRADVGAPAPAPAGGDAEPPRIVIPGKRTEPTVPRDQRGPQPKKKPAAAGSPAAPGRAPTPPVQAASPAASARTAPPATPRQPASPRHAASPRQPASPSRKPSPDGPAMVMWVAAKPGGSLEGAPLLRCMQVRGLQHDGGVFYKFDPTTKGEWFMVANGIEPGTFDAANMGALATPRIALLLRLAAVRNVTEAFEDMLNFAQDVANEFGGEIQDENRGVLNMQGIEKYRQRIREFKRTPPRN